LRDRFCLSKHLKKALAVSCFRQGFSDHTKTWCFFIKISDSITVQPANVGQTNVFRRFAMLPTCFETFRSFLLRKFGHWNISVICLTVILKLASTVFFSLCFQTFWPKWLTFFRSFQNHFGLWPKKKTASHMRHQNSSFIYFHVRFCSGNGHGGAVLRGI